MKLNWRAVNNIADYFDEEISIGRLAERLECSQEDAQLICRVLELKVENDRTGLGLPKQGT